MWGRHHQVWGLRNCRLPRAIRFFGRRTQQTLTRSKPLLKVRSLAGNFSFNAVPVSLNCFRLRQIDLALQESVPYVTSKIALKGNSELELDKSDDALCLVLNARRHTYCVGPRSFAANGRLRCLNAVQGRQCRSLWKFSIKLLEYVSK